jgi:hypothetical protein
MVSVLETFDAGVPPNTVVAGTNGIQNVMEGTQIYATGYHGAACVRAGSAANTVDTRFRVDLGMTGNHSGSTYMKCNTAHGSGSASVNFFHIVDTSNSFVVQFRSGPSNALAIRVGGSNVYSGAINTIPIGSWIRLDWRLTGTSFDWRWFSTDPDGASGTQDLSGTVTGGAFTSARLILGAQSSSAILKDWSFDTCRFDSDNTLWHGPYVPPAPPSSGVTVWNGAAELDASFSLWNGTSEVALPEWEIAT